MKIQEKYGENAFTTTETILLSCSTALVYGTVVRLELRLEHLGFFPLYDGNTGHLLNQV